MKRVIIESPYAGKTPEEVAANVEYARKCMLDSLRRGEAPFLSHLLYTQVLDDTVPEDRKLGIDAGLEWGVCAEATVVYTDRGTTPGMQKGIANATARGRPVAYRAIDKVQVRMTTKLREIQDRLVASKAEFVRAIRALDIRALPEALRLCDVIEAEEKAEIEAIRRRVTASGADDEGDSGNADKEVGRE